MITIDQFITLCVVYFISISLSVYFTVRWAATRIVTGRMDWNLVAKCFGSLSMCCLLCWLVFKISIRW